MGWKVLQRKTQWVDGATITESVLKPDHGPHTYRKFVATVRGFEGFRIWEGYYDDNANVSEIVEGVRSKVTEVRDRIDSGDDSVFHLVADSIQEAHKAAQSKAKYSHRPWIVWQDKHGQARYARATAPALRCAIADANGKKFTGYWTDGCGMVLTPGVADVWLSNAASNSLS